MSTIAHPGRVTTERPLNFWPAYIDMLTSVLMFFLLMYFVEQHLNPGRISAIIAQQKREQFMRAFQKEFRVELERKELLVAADLNILQITFGDKILFDPQQTTLRSRGAHLLRRLGSVLAELHQLGVRQSYDQIQIEGHTDDEEFRAKEYPRDNWELSTARALVVMRFLTRHITPSVDEKRLSVNGYAATRPVGNERSKNRRIELRLYFSGRDGLAKTTESR